MIAANNNAFYAGPGRTIDAVVVEQIETILFERRGA
jgi:hypothetical protein